jgi:hypothetical protein
MGHLWHVNVHYENLEDHVNGHSLLSNLTFLCVFLGGGQRAHPVQGGLVPPCAGLIRSKQEKLELTITRAFQRIKELSFGLCHEKVKFMLLF